MLVFIHTTLETRGHFTYLMFELTLENGQLFLMDLMYGTSEVRKFRTRLLLLVLNYAYITKNGHVAILTLLELCTLLINDYINILFRQQ